ncbi:HypC/HybG/HupF family hydrogenase formation chaperone [Bdellovibrionota bacterium FG-2]
MCLAIPMKVLEIQGTKGTLEVGGVMRTADLSLVAPVSVGQFVIVHAGFAISLMQEDEAQKTLALFREIENSEPPE